MAVRTNLVTNPSAETNTTDWTANGGATLTSDATQFYVGTKSLKVACTAVANSGTQCANITASAAQTYTASIYLRGNAGGETVDVQLRNQVPTTITTTPVTLTTAWQRFTVTGTTPGGTTSVHLRVNKTAATAHTYFADGALVELSATLGAYFDGATADDTIYDRAWTGTANASTSTETERAPIVVTGFTDASPSPRVEIVLSSVPVAVITMTVEQITSSARTIVRGANRAAAAGGFAITDLEVPLGIAVTYQASGYDNTGALVAQSPVSASVTLDPGSTLTSGWLSDPLAPLQAMLVQFEARHVETLSYKAAGTVLPILGSRLPVAVTGARRAPSDVPLAIITRTVGEAETLQALLEQAGVLCLRPCSPEMRLPAVSYLAAAELTEKPYKGGFSVWSGSVDLVAPQASDAVLPLHTWTEVIDAYDSWTALIASKATWLDVIRDPT